MSCTFIFLDVVVYALIANQTCLMIFVHTVYKGYSSLVYSEQPSLEGLNAQGRLVESSYYHSSGFT